MSKKSYQKRLPTVLPPPLPAPRRSPEAHDVARPLPPADAPLALPRTPTAPSALEPPVRRRPSRTTTAKIVVVVLASVAAVGLLVSTFVRDPDDRPAPPTSADAEVSRKVFLAPDEAYLESAVLAGGEVVVRHWIRPASPIRKIRLRLPQIERASELSAIRVQVYAGGRLVAGPNRVTDRGATYAFDPTTRVRLSYQLTGAVERSSSADGRALVLATNLDVRYATPVKRDTRVVSAAEVLSLACSAPPPGAPAPCGSASSPDRWEVELTGPDVADTVIAAVTLG